MSKPEIAVIKTGGKQYVVSVGDTLNVELIGADQKQVTFEPLMVISGESTTVGTPTVGNATVTADVLGETRADKVTSIRYKAKKRVHKLHGHRQHLTTIKIAKIA